MKKFFFFILLCLIALAFHQEIRRGAQISYEIGVEEFGAVVDTALYYFETTKESLERIVWNKDNPSKVLILIHGSGGGGYMFTPLIEKLNQLKNLDIVTLEYSRTEKDQVPLQALQEKIASLSKNRSIEIGLIGHSLGAIISAKYLWRTPYKPPNSKVTLFISIAGRLKDAPNEYEWFYEDIKPEIASSWDAMQRSEVKPEIYTVYGSDDDIVPEESVHSISPKENRLTVDGPGHLGILYAPEALNQITLWVQDWLNK